jgi:hypothetical protein
MGGASSGMRSTSGTCSLFSLTCSKHLRQLLIVRQKFQCDVHTSCERAAAFLSLFGAEKANALGFCPTRRTIVSMARPETFCASLIADQFAWIIPSYFFFSLAGRCARFDCCSIMQSSRFKTSGIFLQREDGREQRKAADPLLLLRNYFVGPELLDLRGFVPEADGQMRQELVITST